MLKNNKDTTMDLIDQEDKVIVIDDKNNSEVIEVEEGMLIYEPSIPKDMYKYVADNAEYESSLDSNDYVERWPVKFESTHHLEDSLWQPALRALKEEFNENFANDIFENDMGGNIESDAIEFTAVWDLKSEGSVRLQKFEYNGITYSRDTRPIHDNV
jgi:hypothetical protein